MEILDEINNLVMEKDFVVAKQKALIAVSEDSNNTEKIKMLGLINVNLECFEEAKENFEKVVEQNKDDATSWFYLGNCYERLNNIDEAKNAYIKVISLRENYLEAYKTLCMLYLQNHEEKKAIEIAEEAKKIDTEDYLFDYLIGTANLALNNSEKAIEALKAALELNNNHAQILGNLAMAYLLSNNQEAAQNTYKKALEIEPENPDILYNYASLLQVQNNHKEACIYFEKSNSIKPNERTLASLALSEIRAGDFVKAIENYKLLVVLHPEKDSYQYNLASCYEQIRDLQCAIPILEKLLVRNPKSVNMAQKLAGLYMDTHNLRKAKDLYDKIILKQTPTASVLYQYAILSSQLYDTDTAEKIFKKVIKMNPENAITHKDLGVIYLNKRLFDYAEDEFKTALSIDPNCYDIVYEYANYLYSVSKFKEADEYYVKALSIKNDVIAKTLRAMNKIELNELEEAKVLIEEALKDEPHHEYIQFMAGRIYFALKDYDEAKRYLIHSIEQNPDIESKNLLALTYFGLEEYQNAVNIFESMIKTNKENVSLLYNAAKCYEKLEENDKALEKLYKLTDIFPEHEDAQEMIRRLS